MTINRISTTIRNVIESDFEDIIELLTHKINIGEMNKQNANISLAIAFKLWDNIKIISNQQRYIIPPFNMLHLEYVYEHFK